MYAAGEKIDVSQSSPFSFPNFVSQGLVEPLDSLPGAADYAKDFTAFTKQVAMVDGKLMGLPYFAAAWVWNYYSDMLEKLKIDKPFSTYEEFIEHCVKAKKDGVSRYPVLWVAGVGLEQLPGTWYQMTWNRGGVFFDKQGNHMLGPGSVARETLKWWANTFEKGLDIADPESLKVQFTSGAKAFGAGKNLYRGPNHHYGLNIANDPAQSPIAGKVKVLGSPGDGKTIADAHVYFLCSANRDKEWAWKLLQYLGGKTKDGTYTQAIGLAKDAMLGSGYQSVMNSDVIKTGWAPWGDVPEILKIWDKSAYIAEVCSSIYQPWHFPWTDQLNIEVQKCLTGQITPDACCDNLIKGIADAKRKV
jgi:ABC-type glycerol-3-phosphate transport system substrate-binding protein